ncbi:hypothetical protein DFQ28_008344 [Apophysomyces sp. BC1034]|nr:hypothetical protein DFQ28_008344 [Apophysomyces sp. BC1034]
MRERWRDPRQHQQQATETACQHDRHDRQQRQLDCCHVRLVRRALSDAEEAPQDDTQHFQPTHIALPLVQENPDFNTRSLEHPGKPAKQQFRTIRA